MVNVFRFVKTTYAINIFVNQAAEITVKYEVIGNT